MEEILEDISTFTSEPVKDPVPKGLDWESYTEPNKGLEWSIIAIAIADPRQIIKIATQTPDKFLNAEIPYGAVKIIFQGTEKQCIKKEKKLLQSNEFNKLQRVKTGVWLPIAPVEILKDAACREIVDSKGREILYGESMKAKASYNAEKANSLKRYEMEKEYDKRIDDENDVLHYVYLKEKERYLCDRKKEAEDMLKASIKALEYVTVKIDQLDIKYPEFKYSWKDALESYNNKSST